MKKICKYELPLRSGLVATIRDEIFQFLEVQMQNGKPILWALADPEATIKEPTYITSFGTGWEISNDVDKYIGTLQDSEGYVWHYFVYKPKEMLRAPTEKEKEILIDGLAALAQAFGKVGTTMEEAGSAFSLDGLFDACM